MKLSGSPAAGTSACSEEIGLCKNVHLLCCPAHGAMCIQTLGKCVNSPSPQPCVATIALHWLSRASAAAHMSRSVPSSRCMCACDSTDLWELQAVQQAACLSGALKCTEIDCRTSSNSSSRFTPGHRKRALHQRAVIQVYLEVPLASIGYTGPPAAPSSAIGLEGLNLPMVSKCPMKVQ